LGATIAHESFIGRLAFGVFDPRLEATFSELTQAIERPLAIAADDCSHLAIFTSRLDDPRPRRDLLLSTMRSEFDDTWRRTSRLGHGSLQSSLCPSREGPYLAYFQSGLIVHAGKQPQSIRSAAGHTFVSHGRRGFNGGRQRQRKLTAIVRL
jgi:hypothetical protein